MNQPIINTGVYSLERLGWSNDHDTWADIVAGDADHLRGRIARADRGYSVVFTEKGPVVAASSSIRSETELNPATGDFTVVLSPNDDPHLAAIAPRTSELRRRAPGRHPRPQVLAANVDDVFVMHGLDRPVNLRRLERQLVIAFDSGATPLVLLSKADEVRAPDEAVEAIRRIAPEAEVLAISARTGRGIDELCARFTGSHSAALMGLSGIGKSTLVNALSGGEVQRTSEVRAADRRGRHTTVTRDLIVLPGGGIVIDTPGIREIGLFRSYGGLARTFPEIYRAAKDCRFADCSHNGEPGCAVQAGVASSLDERRLEHYRELKAELAHQEADIEEWARRAESRNRAAAEDRRDGTRPPKRKRR